MLATILTAIASPRVAVVLADSLAGCAAVLLQSRALSDVVWVSLAAFAGFEIALAASYLLLKVLLRLMQTGRGAS